MPPVGFEPTNSAGERPQTYDLGWFYTSAQNVAFETLAVKRFLYYLHSSVPTARW